MSKIPRLYLDPSQFGESQVELNRENRHYLEKVLRLRLDDEFVVMDGLGKAWRCSLKEHGKAEFKAPFEAVKPLPCSVTVGLALCKGTRFETALEGLAELGAARVVPITTERSERKVPSEQRLGRWRTIAQSASALAYRAVPMIVDTPISLDDFLGMDHDDIIFCHPEGSSPSELLSTPRPELTVVIGPEGGFSSAEVEGLSVKAKMMNLGPTNLRVATAAIVSVGLVLNLT